MPNPRLATRYAKALIDLAIEKGQLETVFADMQWLNAVCKSNRDFVNVLRSPIINADVKKKIIEAVTTGRISEMTAGFNRLIITKGRESNLPEIANAFIEAYKEKKNIHTVKLTTALPVNEATKSAIVAQVKKLTTASPVNEATKTAIVAQVKKSAGFQNIELEEKIDADLIGGFVLQIGDKMVDASVAYDLRAIAKQFENNDFIYKLK
jgi:F-type H+-transporting ATPase subunit delta